MKTKTNNKKGFALIWVLLVTTGLLILSTVMADVIVKESRMSMNIDDSTKAESAAESGVEWGKFCVSKPKTNCGYTATGGATALDITTTRYFPSSTTYFQLENGSQYQVKIYHAANASDYLVTSTGFSNSIRRVLEYTVSNRLTLTPDANEVVRDIGLNGSFSMSFDFWEKAPASNVTIGISNSQTGPTQKQIYFNYNAATESIDFKYIYNGVVSAPQTINLSALASFNVTDVLEMQVRLEYVNDTAASLTISYRDNNFKPIQLPPVFLDLNGKDFFTTNKLNSFVFNPAIDPSYTAVGNDAARGAFVMYDSSRGADAAGEVGYIKSLQTQGITYNGLPTGLTNSGGGKWTSIARLDIDNFVQDYETEFDIPYASEMKADFSDIRFWDETTNTELPYWIESSVASSTAHVMLRTGNNNNIYLLYGNSSAVSSSSAVSTWHLYDSFDNLNNWDQVGTTPYYSSGSPMTVLTHATACGAACGYANIETKASFSGSMQVEFSWFINRYESPPGTHVSYKGFYYGGVYYGSSSNYSNVCWADWSFDAFATDANSYESALYTGPGKIANRCYAAASETGTQITKPTLEHWRQSKFIVQSGGPISEIRDTETASPTTYTTGSFPGVSSGKIGIYSNASYYANILKLDWMTVRRYSPTVPTVNVPGL